MFIFPMVGRSKRFFDAGYKFPKYQLDLNHQSIFYHAVDSFRRYFDSDNFLFIVRRDFDAKDFVLAEILKLGIKKYEVITLENETDGQAHTCFEGLVLLQPNLKEELFIFNIDTFRPNFIKPQWIKNCDGYLEVFTGEGDGWSFIEPGPNKLVIRTTEKDRISNFCSDGLYYFREINLFKEAYEEARRSKYTVNKEYYVAPLYNLLIQKNFKVNYEVVDLKDLRFCGTPKEFIALGGNAVCKA